MSMDVEYVLPLKWDGNDGDAELTGYLRRLAGWAEVTVVDGSAPEVFAEHRRLWAGTVRHIRPTGPPQPNGKVRGVLTGLELARHDRVVIADDDVRYTHGSLRAVVDLLDGAELVCPQNHFVPRPWHARWDTARSLVNRAFASDYPGTMAVRRGFLLAAGGYRGDVLFENLELMRTVRAHGGRCLRADQVFVERRPPRTAHFLHQRIRQAYDSQAQPVRLAAELALLPGLALQTRRPRGYLAWLLLPVLVAELGRRRHAGRCAYGPGAALWAPAWMAERALCAWLALGFRVAGGVPYAGGRLLHAAHSVRTIAGNAAGRWER